MSGRRNIEVTDPDDFPDPASPHRCEVEAAGSWLADRNYTRSDAPAVRRIRKGWIMRMANDPLAYLQEQLEELEAAGSAIHLRRNGVRVGG